MMKPNSADASVGLHREYTRAIGFINGMRETSSHLPHLRGRHWSRPYDQVSADFYCSAEHPYNGWFCLLADAAGHGLASAVFSLHAPMLFREAVLMGMSLPSIYERMHRFFCDQQVEDHFVCGILVHIQGREVEIINAGMPDALLLSADGRVCEAFRSTNLPLGVDDGTVRAKVIAERYRLGRDETAHLLLYSDGLTELGVVNGLAFGSAGVLALARHHPDAAFDTLVEQVMAREAEIHDDVSIAMVPIPDGQGGGADVDETGLDAACSDNGDEEARGMNALVAKRILEHLDFGVVLADAEQRILYVNSTFMRITGYSRDEVLGQTPRILRSGRHDAAFYKGMWRAITEEDYWSGEVWNRRKDGSIYFEWLTIRAIESDEGEGIQYLAVFNEITRREEQEDRLRFLSLQDPLTGLANRLLLGDRGSRAMRAVERNKRTMGVLFIDLDRFKSINETLGHDIGDEVLVQVAQRLQSSLGEDDTLSRFGGDQFVCLLPDIAERQDAARLANKLLAALDRPVEVAGHRFKVGASIGISIYPPGGHVFDDLVVDADRAMIRAKQAGGNLVKFFSVEMAVAVERQLEKEMLLDAAIKSGHLELHYQPKLDLQTRSILGAEALVRWRDPQRGLILPADFIPMAERSDLIAKIGNWVLFEVCSMLARRQPELPHEFHVAVNISPVQMERCDLPAVVRRILSETGIHPGQLQLEVTESMFIHDPEAASAALHQIGRLGVSVALDDFGTGYSNLAILSRLPLDSLKLDRSFVQGVHANPANLSIARSVWHLAEGLGKQVVAEGIETCEECMQVMALGYRLGQGFCMGRPQPEDEFFAALERQGGVCNAWFPEAPCQKRG